MKFRWDKKYLYWGITAFLVICAGLCFYYLLFHGSNIWIAIGRLLSITMPIVDGFCLAYLLSPILNVTETKILYPICKKINKEPFSTKVKKRIRKISILFTLVFVVFVFYCFLSILIPQIANSIQSIILQFPYYIENLNDWIVSVFDNNPEFESTATTLLNRYSARVEEWLTGNLLPQMNLVFRTISSGLIGSVIGVARATWNLLIGFIISVYLLDSKEKFAGQGKKFIYSLCSTETANVFISNVRFIHKTFIGFLGGKIIDSIIIGILCYFGTILMGTPYPILISVIIGVTNIIPFFGPYIGAIPSALLILMIDPIQCLYFIIFILILQQFDGNILGPKILGDSTGLSSFWVIFSITLFGGLFGVFGMIIGVPVFAVVYAGIRVGTDRRLEDRKLPTSTDAYLNVGSIEQNHEFINYNPIHRKQMNDPEKVKKHTEFNWTLLKKKSSVPQKENESESAAVSKNDEINK